MKHHILSASSLLSLLAAIVMLAASCTADHINGVSTDDNMHKVTFSLTTRAANEGAYTADAVSAELIHSYIIAVTSAGSNTIIEYLSKELTIPAERDDIDMVLPTGSYDVYAFANIPATTLSTYGITENGTIDKTALASARFLMPAPFKADALLSADDFYTMDGENKVQSYMPMTSICGQRLDITERASESYGIEVVRMYAKLEFQFSNPTNINYALHSQSISNLTINKTNTEGSIYLMKRTAEDTNRQTLEMPDAETTNKTLSFSYGTTPLAIAAGVGTDAEHPVISKTFYVLESKCDPITNSFTLNFDLRADGSTDESLRFALTDPSVLTMIHRNDWIRIPVTLGDYELVLQARSYPPIGGYPEADIETADGGFKVQFKTPGDFSIRPALRKYGTTNWIYLDDPLIQSYTIAVNTADPYTDIFKSGKQPTKKNSEILGSIKTGVPSGSTALVTLTININDSKGINRTLIRKMYITV